MALEIRSIIWPQLWAINSMLKDYKTVLQTTYILDHAPLVTSLHSIPMPTDNGTAKQTIDGVGHTPFSDTLPPCSQTMEHPDRLQMGLVMHSQWHPAPMSTDCGTVQLPYRWRQSCASVTGS